MELEIRLNGIEVTLKSARIYTSESVLEACQSLLQAIQKVSETENSFLGIEFEPTIEWKGRTGQCPPSHPVRRWYEGTGNCGTSAQSCKASREEAIRMKNLQRPSEKQDLQN